MGLFQGRVQFRVVCVHGCEKARTDNDHPSEWCIEGVGSRLALGDLEGEIGLVDDSIDVVLVEALLRGGLQELQERTSRRGKGVGLVVLRNSLFGGL